MAERAVRAERTGWAPVSTTRPPGHVSPIDPAPRSRVGGHVDESPCAAGARLEEAVAAVAGRWKHTIVALLASGPQRRAEIDRGLPDGVSAKVVTAQLRALEADGIIARTDCRAVRGRGPRHVRYALTPLGRALRPAVEALACWAGELRQARRDRAHADLRVTRPPTVEPVLAAQARKNTAQLQSTRTCVATDASSAPVR